MSKGLGTLVVVVLKAKNLYDKHSFYKQDPFTQITLNGSSQKTEIDVKGGQHPEWDAEFRFPITEGKEEKHRTLEIVCFRKEPRKDEEIGKGKLNISSTIKTGEFDGEDCGLWTHRLDCLVLNLGLL
jgi:Ca2+-dependent lipid-binding protein